MIQEIRQQLEHSFSTDLLEKLFESYQLANENYYLGKHRPCCSEGGRFAEVVLRMLQQITSGTCVPLGQPIARFNNEVIDLEKADTTKFPQSIRIQIPRTLQVIYDIRNKRDVGHAGGDVDANFSDATLSLACCNWVMTELLRIYYTSDITTAQKLVDSLVKIRIPLIQDFNGFLKLLDPKLFLPQKILALLYYRDSNGATIEELNLWLANRIKRGHMSQTLDKLEHEKAFIHKNNSRYFITETGKKFAEENISFQI
jgi:predicted transcriptional regulator